jgi:oligoribonuclease NrnB/cAMP/cGMP phosphodiesterase (DHH superfamily)
MKPLIIYHGNCLDGNGAAVVAYKYFGEEAEYRAAHYGDPPPTDEECSNRIIYMLDFSFPRKEIERMYKHTGGKLTVIDHHYTAKTDLEGLDYTVFNMNHCGAYLAWEFFYPALPVPQMILYIQDKDLWKWHLPNSREISAALHAESYDFQNWLAILESWDKEEPRLIADGKAIIRVESEFIEDMVNTAETIEISGIETLAVNASVLQSEVLAELSKIKPPMGVGWVWDGSRQLYKVSLRSTGDFDVSEIAKTYGGGGHKNSAGFICKRLPWKKKSGS